MAETIEIYTDGAASGNPGPGGFGIVMKFGTLRKEFFGGYRRTTNNRMELLGVIVALEQIKNKDIPVVVYSDSRYVVDAINLKWIQRWRRTNFEKKANVDLWLRFLRVYNPKIHSFVWVKGHAENAENNRCDQLAVQASKQPNLPDDPGFEGERKLI